MKTVFVILAALLFCSPVFSQSLKPKTDFGSNGKVVTNIANDAKTYNNAVALQADGRILLGGTGLSRMFSNGILDSSFGGNGSAFSTGYPEVNSIAIQPDGKIITTQNGNDGIVVRRTNSNGNIDSTFNATGATAINQPGQILYSRSIILQPDGKVLITGEIDSSGKTKFFVTRLLQNGTPDNSFNGNGKLIIAVTGGNNNATDIALQSSGNIIVTGTGKASDTSLSKLVAIRLFADGTRDFSFNTTGIFQYGSPNITAGEYGRVVKILANDKILLSGGTNAKLLVIKLKSNGNTDSTFNGNGIVITEIGQFNIPSEMHILPGGKILVTGETAYYQTVQGYDYAAFQFDSTGQADNSFNGNGKTSYPLLQNDHCGGSVVLSNGKFIITGFRDTITLTNAVRFNANGSIDNLFGSNGIVYLQTKGTDEYIKKILVQPDNKIIAIGYRYAGEINKGTTAFIRYNANGTIDSSFGTNGIFLYDDPGVNIHSAILQNDGKIVVSVLKYSFYPDYYKYIGAFRLNTNGTMDYNFAPATNGLFLMEDVITEGYGNNIVQQPDGKILLTGNFDDPDEPIVLIRLNVNGTADNSFGINGMLVMDADTTINYVGSIVLQPDGKILLAGDKVYQDSLAKFFVMRFLANGTVDNSFGNNGLATNPVLPLSYTYLASMELQPGGKIIIGGSLYDANYTTGNVALARFNPDGSGDSLFNMTGSALYANTSGDYVDHECNAIAIDQDSSIYLTGLVYDTGYYRQKQFIIRVKSNGLQDSTLSSDGTGWLFSNYKGRFTYANDIKISNDSTILTGEGIMSDKEDIDFAVSAYKKINGRLYTFTGNGNWNNAANWSYGIVPPSTLPAGSVITINPIVNGSCTLSGVQHIVTGASLNVKTGAKLIIQNGLIISN